MLLKQYKAADQCRRGRLHRFLGHERVAARDARLGRVGLVRVVWQAVFLESARHDGPKTVRATSASLPALRQGGLRALLIKSDHDTVDGIRICG